MQTDVKVWGSGPDAKCTLYVGWDAIKGSPGPIRRAATLGSINVTGDASGNENPNTEFKVLTQVHHEGESMDATPVASRFEHALALIYVQRNATGTTETLLPIATGLSLVEQPAGRQGFFLDRSDPR